jgi:hypothetical protein
MARKKAKVEPRVTQPVLITPDVVAPPSTPAPPVTSRKQSEPAIAASVGHRLRNIILACYCQVKGQDCSVWRQTPGWELQDHSLSTWELIAGALVAAGWTPPRDSEMTTEVCLKIRCEKCGIVYPGIPLVHVCQKCSVPPPCPKCDPPKEQT